MAVSFDFAGRTAVVTGGAGGIGAAVARRLLSSGSRVWVWDAVATRSTGIESLVVDTTDAEQIERAVACVLDRDSRIDMLVNSVGYLGGYLPLHDLESHVWRRVLDVNLTSVLEVCRQVLPSMRTAGQGRIVNMGSLAGKEGLPGLSAYSAASAGVIAFSKALGRELAETGIRVNCVAPGPVDTDLITKLGPAVVDSMVAGSPMKRLGTVAEVAELVVWLCSDACSFNSGAVFDMSGGRAGY